MEDLKPHGFLDVSQDQSRLVFVGNGHPGSEMNTTDDQMIVVTVFDAARLEQLSQAVIRTNGRTVLNAVSWSGSHVVIQSISKGWESKRIDVVEFSDETSRETRILLEDFEVSGPEWSWLDGTLYVLMDDESDPVQSLVAYQGMEAAMSRWSGDEYEDQELLPFADQAITGDRLGLRAENNVLEPMAAKGPSTGRLVSTEDGRNLTIETPDRTVINSLAAEVDMNWRSLSTLAFSPNEENLLLVGKMAEMNGDRVDWEIFDVTTGLQLFPITAFGFWPRESESYLTGGLATHLEPFAWTRDGRCLVFSIGRLERASEAAPQEGKIQRISNGDEFAAATQFSVLPPSHLTAPRGRREYLIHPVLLSDSPCPAWFLDLAQEVYRVRRLGVTAVGPLPAPRMSFREVASKAAEEHDGSEYARWARLLAEVAP